MALTFSPGMFVWRELMTGDVERARRFYAELLGWSWSGTDMGPAGTYWHASRGGQEVCGLMAKPPGAPMPSAWSSYVLVADVDAAVDRARAAGGQVLRPPDDIPGVGRFAVIADPWGAVVLPFRASGREGEAPPQPGVGSFCWETLVTPDPAAAIAFYERVIGHGSGPSPHGGEGRVLTAGQRPVADVQRARPGQPACWSTYVAVDDALATRDAAAGLGGRVLVPRIDVPETGTVAVVADPTGAALGLFEAKKDG